jgi:fatty-acyl-CoA synthase
VATGMLDWLSNPTDTHAIRFAQDGEGWEKWSYARLASATYSAAEQLIAAGTEERDVVAIIIRTGPAFVAAYFGALIAGATPAPLVPPAVFESDQEYVRRTAELLVAGVGLVATEDGLMPLVHEACELARVPKQTVAISLVERTAAHRQRAPSELALLQFTSGSSGRPRGVKVGFDNLETNIQMIRDWIDWRPEDAGAHWLPLYHDMGLIGCLLTPVVNQRDLWIMRPEHFVADPMRWLDCFGRSGANFTAGPNFAFSYAVNKINPEQLEGSDFSAWRGAIIGAERLDAGALSRFAEMLKEYGFRREVFLPAYGLAEATLAVTVLRMGTVARAVQPDWTELAFGSPVTIKKRATLGEPVIGSGAGWLTGCGEPLPGVTVSIHEENGNELPQGHVGEIRVTGPTLTRGYVGPSSSLTKFDASGLTTGDAGFLYDGDLYVIGRLGDAVKVRGKTLYAEDLEAKLSALRDVPVGRCVVLPGADDGAAMVALVERPGGPWVEEAAKVLLREAGAGAHIRILSAERGTIMRTSSGKPRRRLMWQALLDRNLTATAIYDSHSLKPTL